MADIRPYLHKTNHGLVQGSSTDCNMEKKQEIKKHNHKKYKTKAALLIFAISVVILLSYSGSSVRFTGFMGSNGVIPVNAQDLSMSDGTELPLFMGIEDGTKVSILQMPLEDAEVPPVRIYDGFSLRYVEFVYEKVESVEDGSGVSECADIEPSSQTAKEIPTNNEVEVWQDTSEEMYQTEELKLTAADNAETLVLLNSEVKETDIESKATPTPTPTKAVKSTEKAKPTSVKTLEQKYNSKMELTISESERTVLLQIVEAEATGEDIYGRMLVANVVINRMHSKEFPDTIQDVVFQDGQFSPIRDGRYESVKVSKKTKEAVERVLSGEDYSKGALYFFARSKTTKTKANWFDNNLIRLFQYGGHEFYIEK